MEDVASKPAMMVMESFQSCKGFRTNGNSPGCVKVEYSGAQPCGLKSPMKRGTLGSAATFEEGVCAGIMESSSGSASVTPAPRSKVRRERCFLVMNMRSPSFNHYLLAAATAPPGLRFIWNGSLLIIPRTSEENL